MHQEKRSNRSPHWRTLLEARWKEQLKQVTELSLAYHVAAEVSESHQETRQLLHSTVAVRRELADTEDALRRLATGDFGHCERCGSTIPSGLLLTFPESRYCPQCTAEYAPARRNDNVGLSLG
jgi:DnaK suppressor protein